MIINDILDLSKLESGKFTLETIEFNIRCTLKALVYSFEKQAAAKGITLNFSIDENVSDPLMGDPVRLQQILANLLSNALKFTEYGSVSLSCRCVKEDDLFQHIQFKVEDTGIGIEQEKLALIFESFTQADNSVSRLYGGTGLGLAITKELVELFKGTIEVESAKGERTVFTVTIPLSKATVSPEVVHANHDRSADHGWQEFRTRRILAVEDNEFNRLLLKAMIDGKGVTCDFATNGREAIERLSEVEYDLVLMDVQMPVMDGIQATRQIRDVLNLGIPVIALTANALPENRETYLKAGFTDCLTKPFLESELLEKMTTHLKLSVVPGNPASEIFQVHLNQLKRLDKGDGFYEKSIQMLVESFGEAMRFLEQENPGGRLEKIKTHLHAIKSHVKLLGAFEMYDAIVQVESLSNDPLNHDRLRSMLGKIVSHGKSLITFLEKELETSSVV